MKISAFILSLTFLSVFALQGIPPVVKKEVKKEQSCAKSKCSKQKASEEKEKDCNNNKGCNPFVPCAMSSCCYLVENFFRPANFSVTGKQKFTLFNDNRISDRLSECWHPPELFS